MSNEKSDFGRGLVVNLVKFYEHFSNDLMVRIQNVVFYLSKPEEERKIMISDNPPDNLNYGKPFIDNVKFFIDHDLKSNFSVKEAISYMITSWAYGATDHLFEIETPKGKEWNDIRKLVNELKNKGLNMRHGFDNKIYEYKDVIELHNLVKEIAILVDKKLGLNPDWGKW